MSSSASSGTESSGPASGLEVIYEPRGLSNLTPVRSRLFKLMGRKGNEVELQQALSIWWLTYANESEKRSNGREARGDQEVILKLLTFIHNPNRVHFSDFLWKTSQN